MPVVALVSDTHLPRFGRSLPVALIAAIEAAQPAVILHLGDHTSIAAFEELSRIAAVEAVAGNNDPAELASRFGLRRVVEVDGARIGLTHGHLGPGQTTPDRAAATFGDDAVDVVAFGHSHIPLVQRRGDLLLVNPGSPTDRRHQPFPTFALLGIEAGRPPEARIVELPPHVPQRIRRAVGSAS